MTTPVVAPFISAKSAAYLIVFGALLAGPAAGAELTWSGAADARFENGGNWGGTAPADDLATDIAIFKDAPSANQPLLASARSIGGLQFGTVAGWALTGAGKLTLGNGVTVGTTTGVSVDASALTQGTDTLAPLSLLLGTTAGQTWLVGTGGTLIVDSIVTKVPGMSALLTVGDPTHAGTVVLGGRFDNSFLALNLVNGVVELNKSSTAHSHALGAASRISGGTLRLTGPGGDQIYLGLTITVVDRGVLDLNGHDEGFGQLSAPTAGGVVTNSSDNTAATLTLTGNGSYAGAFTGNLSIVVGGGGQGGSAFTGSINNAGTITNTGAGTGIFSITGAIGPRVTGVVQNSPTSVMNLTGSNTFTGGLTIKAGTVNIRDKALGATPAANIGTITLGDSTGPDLASRLNVFGDGVGKTGAGSSPINVAGAGAHTISVTAHHPIFSGLVTLNSADLTLLTSNDAGSILTFTGGFAGKGNLTLQSNATTSARSCVVLSGASVNPAGTITNSGTGVKTGMGSVDTTINAVIGDNITQVIQASPSSALILTAANTYAGATTVSVGKLVVTGSIASSKTITVAANASLQLGTGKSDGRFLGESTSLHLFTGAAAGDKSNLILYFTGSAENIGDLYINDVRQPPGTYDAAALTRLGIQATGDGALVTGAIPDPSTYVVESTRGSPADGLVHSIQGG